MNLRDLIQQLRLLGLMLESAIGSRDRVETEIGSTRSPVLRVTPASKVTAALGDAIRSHKADLLEAVRRAELMLATVRPGEPLKLFVLRDPPERRPGECESCGSPAATWRCDLCAFAAFIAVQRLQAPVARVTT